MSARTRTALALVVLSLGVAALVLATIAAFNSARYTDAREWAAALFALGMLLTLCGGIAIPIRPRR